MMITNARIKQLRSLKDKKFRDGLGLFVVEGEKMVNEVLASGMEVVEVWRSSEIGEDAMSRISMFSTPSPVLAVVRKPEQIVAEMVPGLSLALDSVRDPGNMGTIIRIADWFGIDTIFASHDCVDAYNPKVVQATMGGLFRRKVIYTDIPQLCKRYREAGKAVYGTFLDGEDIYGSSLATEGLVVMGNESNGISPAVAAEVTSRLLIPRGEGGAAESLNVAVASAVILSEFNRRTR